MLLSFQFIVVLGVACLGYWISKGWQEGLQRERLGLGFSLRRMPLLYGLLVGVTVCLTAAIGVSVFFDTSATPSPCLPTTFLDFAGPAALSLALNLLPYPVAAALGQSAGRRWPKLLPKMSAVHPVLSRAAENLLRDWFAQYGELLMFIGHAENRGREMVMLRSFRQFRRVLAEWKQPTTVAEIHGPEGKTLQLRPNI